MYVNNAVTNSSSDKFVWILVDIIPFIILVFIAC